MILQEGEEIAPGIMVYDNVIDNCEELINFAKSQPWYWKESAVGSGKDSRVDKDIRNTHSFSIDSYYDADIVWFDVAKTIWKYADSYGKNYDVAFSAIEPIQMLHYQPTKSFYQPHVDSGPGVQRVFSAVLYLNDVKEGGETYFNRFDASVKPKAGRLAVFPANYVYMHEARPLPNEDKYVIVTWFVPVF